MGLSLEKKQELVGLSLEKRKVPKGIVMAVKTCIDVSGSIQPLFRNGTMQELIDRLIPLAMRFDDNQSLECYAFGDSAVQVGDIKPSDFNAYVPKFLKSVPDRILWSGTKYSRAFQTMLDDLKPSQVGGFLKNMFGKSAAPQQLQPSYIMFITDGETNYDEQEAEDVLREMAGYKTYVQLIGVGSSSFRFLQKMADKYDHVGFVTFPKLERTPDDQMYEALLSEELCTWIKAQ